MSVRRRRGRLLGDTTLAGLLSASRGLVTLVGWGGAQGWWRPSCLVAATVVAAVRARRRGPRGQPGCGGGCACVRPHRAAGGDRQHPRRRPPAGGGGPPGPWIRSPLPTGSAPRCPPPCGTAGVPVGRRAGATGAGLGRWVNVPVPRWGQALAAVAGAVRRERDVEQVAVAELGQGRGPAVWCSASCRSSGWLPGPLWAANPFDSSRPVSSGRSALSSVRRWRVRASCGLRWLVSSCDAGRGESTSAANDAEHLDDDHAADGGGGGGGLDVLRWRRDPLLDSRWSPTMEWPAWLRPVRRRAFLARDTRNRSCRGCPHLDAGPRRPATRLTCPGDLRWAVSCSGRWGDRRQGCGREACGARSELPTGLDLLPARRVRHAAAQRDASRGIGRAAGWGAACLGRGPRTAAGFGDGDAWGAFLATRSRRSRAT